MGRRLTTCTAGEKASARHGYQSLAAMQAMQVTYGLSTAADVAFYSYIYRLLEEADYQLVVR